MLDVVKNLFNKTKSKLYFIELDDDKLNREMSAIIKHMELEITEFKKSIDETTLEVKDGVFVHFYEEMMKMKEDLNIIKNDVNKIVGMKLENLKYFIIKDDTYLLDKKRDLERIHTSIEDFLGVVEQRPSKQALKKNVLNDMYTQLENIQRLLSNIIAEDISLQHIYKRIKEV